MQVIQEALDALGLALVEHGHQWTPHERDLYEKATAFLAKPGKKLRVVVERDGRIRPDNQ